MDGRTENIYSIFRDKLLLPGEHVYQHVQGDGLHGICRDGVWCCNQPNFLTLHPSNSETDFVSLNIITTIASCPSFWIVLEQWFFL